MICRVLFTIAAFVLLAACSSEQGETASAPADRNPAKFNILAFSWQPAFCEGQPGKPECKTQTGSRFDASHFTLHGLWPRGAYCKVPEAVAATDKRGDWFNLEPLRLSGEVRQKLETVMPGIQSGLHRHEWVKHGTCYGTPAEEYYADSLWLMDELNASRLRTLFAENIGRRISREEIRSAMDESFGKGAGDRARVKCRRDADSGRELIVEITIALSGDIAPDTDLGKLLLAAKPDKKAGCPGGIVDPVGLQ